MKFRRTFKVETVQNMGSDEMIARAARVSTGKDLLEQDKIKGLIGYLVPNGCSESVVMVHTPMRDLL